MKSHAIVLAHLGTFEEVQPVPLASLGDFPKEAFELASDMGYIRIADGCFTATEKGKVAANMLESLLLGDILEKQNVTSD